MSVFGVQIAGHLVRVGLELGECLLHNLVPYPMHQAMHEVLLSNSTVVVIQVMIHLLCSYPTIAVSHKGQLEGYMLAGHVCLLGKVSVCIADEWNPRRDGQDICGKKHADARLVLVSIESLAT